MIARVGAVGPKDSIELITEIGKEFQEEMTIIPMIYQKIEDTPNIIQQADGQIDIWVFSGQAPYAIARDLLHKQKMLYPQLNGSSLTKVLLELVYRDRWRLDRVSFDTFLPKHLQETCTELGLPYGHIHLLSYPGYKPSQELAAFHSALYRDEKVDACATCISSVYEALKAEGIPVYRITPNRMTIRSMLNLARTAGETLHFKKSQIAVMLIELSGLETLIGENKSAYDVSRLHLRLQDTILDYVEEVSGSFISLGNGKYLIFSTRGAIEGNPDAHASMLLERIAFLTDLETNIGIGYGVTALAAERNAQLALLHSQKTGSCAILVDDEGRIEGPLEQPDSISFTYRTDDMEMSGLLKKAGVAITTYAKLQAVQKHLGKHSLSAPEVAEFLGMTKRNARRILTDLAAHGLAELIGEEAPTNRGRPRKIYRIPYRNRGE
ncbi:hypothetical protein ACI7RC_09325 [Brevibacillus sp. B_LB10_24]|uniref:hypothetical protein n=1 Tax=Brevibacillus sp. B_LB10_24 TaxID=3380645 RepID=UPI0038B7DFCB